MKGLFTKNGNRGSLNLFRVAQIFSVRSWKGLTVKSTPFFSILSSYNSTVELNNAKNVSVLKKTVKPPPTSRSV